MITQKLNWFDESNKLQIKEPLTFIAFCLTSSMSNAKPFAAVDSAIPEVVTAPVMLKAEVVAVPVVPGAEVAMAPVVPRSDVVMAPVVP